VVRAGELLAEQQGQAVACRRGRACALLPSGRRVEATRSVDPGLIGGLVLAAGSFRVDASVRGRLNSLRQELVARS